MLKKSRSARKKNKLDIQNYCFLHLLAIDQVHSIIIESRFKTLQQIDFKILNTIIILFIRLKTQFAYNKIINIYAMRFV